MTIACASTARFEKTGPLYDCALDEDYQLVVRLIEDDPIAWREFNTRYSSLIYGCIQRVIRRFPHLGVEDAREIFATFCLQLLANDKRKLRSFEAGRGTRFSTWLGLLTSNAAYDYLRSIRREPCRSSVGEAERLSSEIPDPFQMAEARQKATLIAALLDDFSERDQQFVLLYYGEGLTPEAIASTLGISVKTVYSKKHKIRARLESALSQNMLAA